MKFSSPRFATLIETRTGLAFDSHRQSSLRKGLEIAAERAGSADAKVYFLCLEQSKTDSQLWDDLISELTIGETYFFRNQSHVEALRQHILPKLITRHQGNQRLRIWSAGCATGEEPYTLAILLSQLIPDIDDWNILILATDINRRALQRAAQAQYRPWSFRETPPEIQKRYFMPNGDTFQLIDSLRQLVTFRYLNLVEDCYPSLTTNTNAMDLIICRNVAIYLPEPVNRAMANCFYHSLSPNGWLIMGASETNLEIFRQFKSINLNGSTVYKKSTGTKPLRWPVIMKTVDSQPVKVSIPTSPAPLHSSHPPSLPATPALQPPETPQKLYDNALVELRAGRNEEAQKFFLACIKKSPQYAPAYYQIARIQANAGYLTKAQEWLAQALEHDPLMVPTHYTLALIHQEKGEFDQAISQYKKVLFLDPNFVLAQYGLSSLYKETNRAKLAKRHLSQAVRLASQYSPDEELPASDGMTAGRLLKMMLVTAR